MPSGPPGVEQSVLRRIREAQARETDRYGVGWLYGVLFKRRIALAALGLVMFISSLTGVAVATSNEVQRQTLASSALGFDVFSKTEILNLDK